MTKIILSGCNGKMGKVITELVNQTEDCTIVAGVDINTQSTDYPVYDNINKINGLDADVIVDFSHPSVLNSLLDYSKSNSLPLVLSTTGYSDEQTELIKEAAKVTPVFFSFNMSLGINLLIELAKKAACILSDTFDIEIIEAHHNQKIDAPSGTAVMISNGIKESLCDKEYFDVYDRHSVREKRNEKEIGVHSIRGGTIVGEHTVMFAGNDEIVSISHSARSKGIFASGAVKAAVFMVGKPAGLYSMKDLIG